MRIYKRVLRILCQKEYVKTITHHIVDPGVDIVLRIDDIDK